MIKIQRLKGMAALTAAMIVTAGTAGAVLGQDGCDDECLAEQSISAFVEALTAGDTASSEEALRQYEQALLELMGERSSEAIEALQNAMGPGDESAEALSELFTDMRPLSDPEQMAELFADAGLGDLLTENISLDFLTEMLEAQGFPEEAIDQLLTLGLSGGFGTLADEDGIGLLRQMMLAQGVSEETVDQLMGLSGGFGTLTDEDGKAVVINHEEQYVPTDPVEASLPRFEDPLGVLEAAAIQAFAEGDIDKPTLDALMGLLAKR
jgi:hypothetical protein